jgi:hypothetical protein
MIDERIECEQCEVDPRFPSGPWKGFWLQQGMNGRQWMRDVTLTFADGRVNGQGEDRVGEFVFRGRYSLDDGKVTLFKRYLGAHEVIYHGCNDGESLWLWGTWEMLPYDKGGFHLWPKGEMDPTGSELEEEADVPAEEVGVVSV